MSLCSNLCLASNAVHQINLGKAKKYINFDTKRFFEQQNMHTQLPTPLHVYNCTDLLIIYVTRYTKTMPIAQKKFFELLSSFYRDLWYKNLP